MQPDQLLVAWCGTVLIVSRAAANERASCLRLNDVRYQFSQDIVAARTARDPESLRGSSKTRG